MPSFALVACLMLLAGCDALSSGGERSTRQPHDPAVADLTAALASLQRAEPSHGVAAIPEPKRTPVLDKAVVVRGNNPDDAPASPRRSVSGGSPGDVVLKFAGADVRDVVSEVLGKALHLNYVIDPDVSGPVTFNIGNPVQHEEILPTLEAVLNSRGATMVREGDIIRVTLLHRQGKPGPAAPIAARSAPGLGQSTEVLSLRFVAPSDMQHVLEKVLPPNQVITADDKRHLLVVQGPPSELQLARDTVRVFDVDQLGGMSMALVPLSHADPTAIADELKNIFATTRKDLDNDAIRFMAVPRLNAVMIISRSAQYLDESRTWLARLDRGRNPNEQRVYVYNLQYGKAAQVGQQLQGLLSGLNVEFKLPEKPSGDDNDAVATGDTTRPPRGSKPADDKGATRPVQPAMVASTKADPPGDPPPGNVRIVADEAHNALLISANARDYDLVRQVLEGIDVPPLQVLIEVTIAEVTLNDALNYGVEYYIQSGNFSALQTSDSSPFSVTPPTPGFALSWVVGKFQPRAVLEALSHVTQTKVISTPRLLVLSNQPARLQVGDVVPIITQAATSTITSNPLVVNNVSYKDTGVVLEVTPRVNSGGLVTLDVNQSVSAVVNTTTSTIDSPTIRQRRLTTTISVKSGNTVLLGGLIQQQDNRTNSGIPVLNEIPGIGALFGTRVNGTGRTELVMLMTPHVIANEDAVRTVTSQVKREFQEVLDGSAMAAPRRALR